LKKYGVDNYTKTDMFQKQYKATCLKKFGCENSSQNSEIFMKQQKARMVIKYFRDTKIYYQGSYEKDFLDKYFDKIKIANGKTIKYKYKEKTKNYFADFYLPEYNMIIEIKNSYNYERQKEINEAKKEYCLLEGYKFIFIINKDYTEFDNLI
jgi:very-short-patch-repair endonuclease